MISGSNIWNQDLIEAILSEVDIVKVLRTSIAPQGNRDSLVYHFNKDGNYSMKYVYKLASSIVFYRSLEVGGE